MTDIEKLGQMVTTRSRQLRQSTPTGLVSRGLGDLDRLATDPELKRLIDELQHPANWNRQIDAWQQIRRLAPETPGWVSSLKQVLNDDGGWASILAAEALAWHGRAEREAIPVLISTLESSLTLGLFEWARVACGAMGRYRNLPEQIVAPALPALLKALDVSDPDVRGYAAITLGNLGPLGQPALVQLARLADLAEPPLKDCYLEALQKIEPHARSGREALLAALEAADPALRCRALDALAEGGCVPPEVVPQLLALVNDQDRNVRKHLALTLGELRTEEQAALGKLKHLQEDSDPAVCLAASYALTRLGIEPQRHLKHLRQNLQNPDPEARHLSAWALGHTGGHQRWRSQRALKGALSREKNDQVRVSMEKAIANLKE